ncbi:MAG: nuclear transport factor 2 family protein [Gemmataceae bacterium]|nr:nuclear transport factor 2 family protein [Gemmataceae bacterium]
MLPTLFVALALAPADDARPQKPSDDQLKEFAAELKWADAGEAKKAVRTVLADQVAAWNKGDLDGFMAGYWDSPDLFFISGGKAVKGFKALKERYDTNYRGEGKEMGKLAFSDIETVSLGPTAVLVRGKWEVTTTKETVGGWYSLVFRKIGGLWKIVHDHTSK